MIKDIIFLIKENFKFFSNKGMSTGEIVGILLLAVAILVGVLFLAFSTGLIGKNSDVVINSTTGIFGVSND